MGENFFDENAADGGEVNISDEVVAVVASIAAKNVPGVFGMQNSIGSGIAEFLGKRNVPRGVKVSVSDENVVVDLYLVVEYGAKIPDVAFRVQEKVKAEIETITGLTVLGVNVHVEGIGAPRAKNERDSGAPDDDEYVVFGERDDGTHECKCGCGGCDCD